MSVLIATYLEPELVERIRAVDPRIRILHAPELLPVPRYTADHHGTPPVMTPADQARWDELLAQADVSFDFDWQAPELLPERAPRLLWVQATSAGIGALIDRTGLGNSDLVITTAAGIHGVPLAEFAVTGAMYFIKGIPELLRSQRAHSWERYTSEQLAGRTVTVVGLGGMGSQTVRTFLGLGTSVVGVGRPGRSYDLPAEVEVVGTDQLAMVLPRTDVLVLCCPLTPETDGLIGAGELDLLPERAILVNLARGRVVDEEALIDVLIARRIAGAALDVTAVEPLPESSPLWDLDNVLISPHSASTVATENQALAELFIDNLQRWLSGRELRNLYQRDLGY